MKNATYVKFMLIQSSKIYRFCLIIKNVSSMTNQQIFILTKLVKLELHQKPQP